VVAFLACLCTLILCFCSAAYFTKHADGL
jgi:hypothetical protein